MGSASLIQFCDLSPGTTLKVTFGEDCANNLSILPAILLQDLENNLRVVQKKKAIEGGQEATCHDHDLYDLCHDLYTDNKKLVTLSLGVPTHRILVGFCVHRKKIKQF